VPKATVNENSQVLSTENEIRTARQGLVPPPPRDPGGTQDCDKPEFGLAVSLGANCGHYLGAFRFREFVGHLEILRLNHAVVIKR
jgi:hypothetical protein